MRTSTVIKKQAALVAISHHLGSIRLALKQSGIGKSQFYQWLREDPSFKLEYEALLTKVYLELASKLMAKNPDKTRVLLRNTLKRMGQ